MGRNDSHLKQWLSLGAARPPLLMGILNTTPDSFSDGGRFLDAEAARRFGSQMYSDGAAIIDVGGESSRPGAARVDVEEQIRRTTSVVGALSDSGIPVSIDTTSARVAEAAIDAGAVLINDISAGTEDTEMFALAARRGVPIVLMHMKGSPENMQESPRYGNVVDEVIEFLKERATSAECSGIPRNHILLDVGIGFGKTIEHNLALLHQHQRVADLGYPMVLGTSRKGFIGTLTSRPSASERVLGTAATVAWGLTNGADLLRVHDVAAMREVMAVIEAIKTASP